jgi:ATP-dependent RNA helicase DDX24/MAK5
MCASIYIEHLSGLLKVLNIMLLTLHACTYQKRHRNLEQFACLEDHMLLATGVLTNHMNTVKEQILLY